MVLKARSDQFKSFPVEALDRSIPARFIEQVAIHRGRPAVIAGATSLSYGALDLLSNRVANLLLAARGDAPEPVALLCDQSPLTVAAILGALKAGKIYLPLDPREPPEQLAGKLSDAGAALILTDQANAPHARSLADPGRPVIELPEALNGSSEADPGLDLRADRPVYIYYTSGSTGSPKGVFDTHRNVLHNILRYSNTLKISCEDRLSLIQAPHFSGTVSSLFGALLNGATLYPLDLRKEGIGELSQVIRERDLTMFHAVPSLFERLLSSGDRFPSLRVIRLEGDQTFKRHVDLFQSHFSVPCVLVNGLGATETGLTRQFFIDQATRLNGSVVPIGFATADMETLIRSPDGRELPPGEVGEIIIRSRYLAKGYWRNPDLTDQVFAPCPSDRALRVYRTGDIGRLRSDGCLEYLGRKDSRIKVHGQWVDLEAIQDMITQLPAVAEALVLSRVAAAREPAIVAYLVPAGSAKPEAAEIRRGLADRLLAEMVPSAYVFLDALPLDANGKLDRKALPAPLPEAIADLSPGTAPAAPPRNESEALLARCWCRALDVAEVGRDDDFFARGGTSLRALDLALKIERAFGVGLPPSIVIEAPTVALMAGALQNKRSVPVLLPLQPLGSKRPFFCVHGHDGDVLQLRALAQALGLNRPVHGFRLPRGAGPEGWVTSVEAMARLYLGALRAQQAEGPYLLGGYCFGGLVAFEMARALAADGQRVACLALIVADAPGGPVVSAPGSWLGRRFSSFRALPGREKSGYIARGCVNLARRVARRARTRLGGFLWQLCEDRGRRPPAMLQNPALVCDIATNRYGPHAYTGEGAVVFGCLPEISSLSGPYGGWQSLISAGVSLRVVEATTSDIMKPPGVESLARELEAAIERLDG